MRSTATDLLLWRLVMGAAPAAAPPVLSRCHGSAEAEACHARICCRIWRNAALKLGLHQSNGRAVTDQRPILSQTCQPCRHEG